MARIRTVKPSYFMHEELAGASIPARFLGIALLTMADRMGRLKDQPRTIRATAFPFDTIDCDRLLDELVACGYIIRYAVNGARFVQVVNFNKHQVLSPREPESALPGPSESVPNQGQVHAQALPEHCPIISEHCSDLQEGKGREGERKGTGTEREGLRETASAVGVRDDLPTKTYPLSAILDDEAEPHALEEKTKGAHDVPPVAPPVRKWTQGDPEVQRRWAEFWKAYPYKVAKPAAWGAFVKARIDDDLLAVILADVERQKVSDKWTRDAGRYIPMPATYLNQQRWQDEGVTGIASAPALSPAQEARNRSNEAIAQFLANHGVRATAATVATLEIGDGEI